MNYKELAGITVVYVFKYLILQFFLQVLYVDYGTVENISIDNMREIEPRYLHLPFQVNNIIENFV